MSEAFQNALDDLKSGDRDKQNRAFEELQALTNEKVSWAYSAWDDLRQDLAHRDGHRRAIAAQLLCNLAKSDPEARILRDLPLLMQVTRDEKFVTARHCLLSLWKVGVVGRAQKEALLRALAERYRECAPEKNCTLIRYDIIQGLKKVHDQDEDEAVKRLALDLIASEPDLKYRKKYSTVWRD
jgi:hypothetical protein